MTTKITFTLPAANINGAAECVLLGEFNNWDVAAGINLKKQADGSMTAEVALDAGKDYQYRYLLSNGRWINDDGEKIDFKLSGYPIENCIVRVPAMPEKEITVKTKLVKTKTAAKAVVVKDDLTKVEGIGKNIQTLLHKSNIQTYKQLSKATVKAIKEILDAGGSKFSMHNPVSWPKQAKLAAEAKWEELDTLQQQLKNGK